MNTIKAMSHLAIYRPKQIPDYKEISNSYVSKLGITLLITTSYSYARIHVSGAGYLGLGEIYSVLLSYPTRNIMHIYRVPDVVFA